MNPWHTWRRSHSRWIGARRIQPLPISENHRWSKSKLNIYTYIYSYTHGDIRNVSIRLMERGGEIDLGGALGRERGWEGGFGGKPRDCGDSCGSKSCIGSHGWMQLKTQRSIASLPFIWRIASNSYRFVFEIMGKKRVAGEKDKIMFPISTSQQSQVSTTILSFARYLFGHKL